MSLKKFPYQNSKASIEKRVSDLLSRMTVKEKIMQLHAIYKDPVMDNCKKENGDFNPKRAATAMKYGMGRLSAPFRTFTAEHGAKVANQVQEFLIKKTRLGIPAIVDAEGIHGSFCIGSTMYPLAIGQASTWNPELIRKMAAAIGTEIQTRGMHAVFSPVIDICRDVRAGRTQETFGEDPYLVTEMGVAYVRGMQSKKVIATIKHFVANFVGDGGRDSHPIHYTERLLREIYLPPYEACIKKAGALSVMSAYHSLDGVPCTVNKWLLTDLLRKEWKFKGHVVSDWFATAIIHTQHKTAETKTEAARKALLAGLDVELPVSDCFLGLEELVKSGKLPIKVIDNAVRNVLYSKFWAGLFDKPYVDPKKAVLHCNHPEYKTLAREVAQQSMVLLKNEKVLPLKKTVKSIAVIGPNANVGRLGGYSCTGTPAISPVDGIKAVVDKNTAVRFAEGCGLTDPSTKGFIKAVELAKKSDVCVLCVGNSTFELEGEGHDRCNLDLPGKQEELVQTIAKVNKNCVVVLYGGSAITISRWLPNVRAVVMAWYPGQEGGAALADVLFGDANPCGKLPITWPKTTGQVPLYYNAKPSGRSYDYVDCRGALPQFPFGFGLSYTTFAYDNLKIRKSGSGFGLRLDITFDIRNSGKKAGVEIAQLYIHDEYSSRSRPMKELKRFERVSLDAGQKKQVKLTLTGKDLSFLGDNLKPVFEPGTFEIMVGGSSEDIRLRRKVIV